MREATRVLLWLLSGSAVPAPALAQAGVELAVRNRTGVTLQAEPVRGGVPFNRGVLRDGTQARLLAADGTAHPCQVRASAHWYDGSVKWLLVDTRVDLPPGAETRWRLQAGEPGLSLARRVTVADTAEAVTVDTGVARFEFPKARFGLPGAVWLDMDGDGVAETQVAAQPGEFVCEVEHQPPGPPAEENWLRDAAGGVRERFAPGRGDEYAVRLESVNGLRAVVRLSGWLVNTEGRKLIWYVIRVHACAGRAELRICPSFVYAGNPKEDFLRSLYLRFPRLADAAPGTWELGGEEPHGGALSGTESVSLLAVGPDKFRHLVPYTEDRTVYYTVVRDDSEIAAGREPAGWARVSDARGSVQVALRNFWQMHPKELRVQRDALTVYLWPELGGKVLDLRRRYDEVENVYHYDLSLWEYGGEGVGLTHDLVLRFGPAAENTGAELAARLNAPLLLECTPAYYAQSMAFGPFAPADPVRYPHLEAAQNVTVEWMRHNQRIFQWNGMIDYGDTLFHGYETRSHYGYVAPKSWCSRGYVGWLNDDGTLTHSLFLQYLRSGDYDTFLTAAEMARHSMDVDVCHHCAAEPRQVGGGHRHDQQHWGNGVRGYGAATQGIMDLYLLTGDERALDVARERAMYHDNGIPAEDEQRVGGLYRFWEISGEEHWRRRALEVLAEELKVAPDAVWRFAVGRHFRFVSDSSVSLQYFLWAAPPEETAPLREAILRSLDGLADAAMLAWEDLGYAPYILAAAGYQLTGEAKYATLLAAFLTRLRLPLSLEVPPDYRAVLRGLPFEEMVTTARDTWRINNLYAPAITILAPLPYVIAALQKAGMDQGAAFAVKLSTELPPPFEEIFDPAKIGAPWKTKGRDSFLFTYSLARGAPDDRHGRSRLLLFEDGTPLGPAHSPHVETMEKGLGRWSHWGARAVQFSTSDNTDPRTTGRQYKVVFPGPEP